MGSFHRSMQHCCQLLGKTIILHVLSSIFACL